MKKNKLFTIGAYALAGCVLAGALVYYNFIDKAPVSGVKEGNRCLDFTAQTFAANDGEFALDGGSFTLSEQIGKVTIVNMWETWCSACVHELPYFDQIQKNYGDAVSVVAIAGVTSTPEAAAKWMTNKGWKIYDNSGTEWADFSLKIAYLPADVCKDLGCAGMLPRTVIVDKSGIVAYAKDGSMTYEDLENIVEGLL